jgi:hypothetical protein
MSDLTRVDRWRTRAKELRAMAESMSDKAARASLLQVSIEWERMADDLERAVQRSEKAD